MQKREIPRLEYLDGLRALAALYVVLFHAGVCFTSADGPVLWRVIRHCLTFGHDAVAVFIVLSGYCLMIPAARRGGFVANGVSGYFGRRAWRILPPYYAALLLSLAVVVLLPGLHEKTQTIWDDTYPALGFGPIATHLAVIHNLFPAYAHAINGPLWSVATEWQIYFFFPFVLLPVWRRSGPVPTVIVGFALGCAPLWFAPRMAAVCNPWYLGLFALGMCAAGIGFSERALDRSLRALGIWRGLLATLAVGLALGVSVFAKLWFLHIVLSDAFVGLTTAVLLVHCTRHALGESPSARPFLLRCLESKPLSVLGGFSYSLYLSHLPVIAVCYFILRRWSLSEQRMTCALLACSVPLSLCVAYVFFSGVERHFLRAPSLRRTSR